MINFHITINTTKNGRKEISTRGRIESKLEAYMQYNYASLMSDPLKTSGVKFNGVNKGQEVNSI